MNGTLPPCFDREVNAGFTQSWAKNEDSGEECFPASAEGPIKDKEQGLTAHWLCPVWTVLDQAKNRIKKHYCWFDLKNDWQFDNTRRRLAQ